MVAGLALVVFGGERRRAAAARLTAPGARLASTPLGALQVVDSGPRDAPPMVLLHCYTCSLHWWDAIVPMLERRHRVIRVDLLGHGGSEKPASGYSIRDQAGAVAAALRDLGVEEAATVVGHSLGFTVATALAQDHPELVDRLVNIGEWSHSDDVRLPLRLRLGRRSIFGRKLVRVTKRPAIRAQLRYAFAPGYDLADGFADPDQVVQDFRALTPAAFEQTDREARAYVDEAPLPQRLAATRIPLLVIFGSEDQCFDSAERVAGAYRTVPGADVRLIAGAGHSPNVERPRETAELILAFAAAAPARSRPSS